MIVNKSDTKWIGKRERGKEKVAGPLIGPWARNVDTSH